MRLYLIGWIALPNPPKDMRLACFLYFNRSEGNCAGDLALALDDYRIGDTVALKVQRGAGDAQGGQELEVSLKLEEDML